jgi:subtilase family serine protease
LPPGKAKQVCDTPAAGIARCHAKIRTDDNLNPLATAKPLAAEPLNPADLRSAYNITADGTERPERATIAIVGAYGYTNAESDLYQYRKAFSLPECTTANGCFKKLNQDGQPSLLPDKSDWSMEAALDLAMASAICPGCNLLLIQANTATFNDLGKAVTKAKELRADAISNSYGADEGRWAANYEQPYNIPGVAVTASTGDSGYGVSFPASSPHVVAVGGTTLKKNTSNSRGWDETVWNGTGSGCSSVFAKPSWQTDKGCGKRTVGDVAAVADPNTGVWVYWNGPGDNDDLDWYVIGGTSVGAPIIAAAYAINGPGPVKTVANVYSQATALNDITTGSNGRCPKGTVYLCTAGAGFDGPTGNGSLNGITALGGAATP